MVVFPVSVCIIRKHCGMNSVAAGSHYCSSSCNFPSSTLFPLSSACACAKSNWLCRVSLSLSSYRFKSPQSHVYFPPHEVCDQGLCQWGRVKCQCRRHPTPLICPRWRIYQYLPGPFISCSLCAFNSCGEESTAEGILKQLSQGSFNNDG